MNDFYHDSLIRNQPPSHETPNPQPRRFNLMKNIKEYDSEEINRILETYAPSTHELLATAAKHQNTSPSLICAAMTETDEQTVREVVYLSTLSEFSLGPYTKNDYEFIGVIRGLKQYEYFHNKPLDALTGEDLKAAEALINTTVAIHAYFDKTLLQVTAPEDPQKSVIRLNDTAANLVIKHRDMIGELIGLYYKYDGDEYSISNYLPGLHHLTSYTQADLNSTTQETIQTVFNIINVTAALSEHTDQTEIHIGEGHPDHRPVYLNNPELETYITVNPDHTRTLITYITERGTANLQGFQQYLSDQTVLRAGVL